MDAGEFLTRATIWITIVAYVVGSVLFAWARGRTTWDSAARTAWTIAVVSLIAHFICAYQFYHDWSHDSAYRDTARQTDEVVGLNLGRRALYQLHLFNHMDHRRRLVVAPWPRTPTALAHGQSLPHGMGS